jgi:CRISPR-associated protein Cas1
MEPYRPYVDEIVYELYNNYPGKQELTKEIKAELLQLLTVDTVFNKVKRPLMIGLSQTTASLAKCFAGDTRKIEYPAIG